MWDNIKVSEIFRRRDQLTCTWYLKPASPRRRLKFFSSAWPQALWIWHTFHDTTLSSLDKGKHGREIIQQLFCARGESGFNDLFKFWLAIFGSERLRNAREMWSCKAAHNSTITSLCWSGALEANIMPMSSAKTFSAQHWAVNCRWNVFSVQLQFAESVAIMNQYWNVGNSV